MLNSGSGWRLLPKPKNNAAMRVSKYSNVASHACLRDHVASSEQTRWQITCDVFRTELLGCYPPRGRPVARSKLPALAHPTLPSSDNAAIHTFARQTMRRQVASLWSSSSPFFRSKRDGGGAIDTLGRRGVKIYATPSSSAPAATEVAVGSEDAGRTPGMYLTIRYIDCIEKP